MNSSDSLLKLMKEEGYEEIQEDEIDPNLERLLKKKNMELFLFEIPKDLDTSKLDGMEIDLSTQKAVKFSLPDGEVFKMERLEEEPEKYLKDQILPIFPIRKKINKKKICYKSCKKY